MRPERREVDAHEGDDQQQEDRLGDIGPKHRAERRQGNPEHDECGNRARALVAEPNEGTQGEGEDALKGSHQRYRRLLRLNGLTTDTPVGSKSVTLRVTTASPCSRAVAAIIRSTLSLPSAALRAPQRRARRKAKWQLSGCRRE